MAQYGCLRLRQVARRSLLAQPALQLAADAVDFHGERHGGFGVLLAHRQGH
jgi:hypothetical protein